MCTLDDRNDSTHREPHCMHACMNYYFLLLLLLLLLLLCLMFVYLSVCHAGEIAPVPAEGVASGACGCRRGGAPAALGECDATHQGDQQHVPCDEQYVRCDEQYVPYHDEQYVLYHVMSSTYHVMSSTYHVIISAYCTVPP
jgi:hypothetical protein